jgi:hypothetical protein
MGWKTTHAKLRYTEILENPKLATMAMGKWNENA